MDYQKEKGCKTVKKYRTAIIGIAMIAVPCFLGTLEFVQELLNGAGFFSGLTNGVFAGLKIIVIIVLVYGIARKQK